MDNQLSAVVKKKYLKYAAFAGQTVEEILENRYQNAKRYEATMLASIQLVNDRKGGLHIQQLPDLVQWSPVFGFLPQDLNGDNYIDVIAVGNFYGVLPYEGRYDAGNGVVMMNYADKAYRLEGPSSTGFLVDGEARDIKGLWTTNGKKLIAVARNNNVIQFFQIIGDKGHN